MNTDSRGMSIDWAVNATEVDAFADFFIANVKPAYISHSELQFGRAVSPSDWSPQLRGHLHKELSAKMSGPPCPRKPCAVATGRMNHRLAALAIVTCHFEVPIPFAVFEDLIVDGDVRSRGLGTQMITWLENQLRPLGIRRVFLESGLGNESAHHFFEGLGFRQCSIVMMKELAAETTG